ncbi:FecCD family ABC transporter permease [Anaerovorax odorimutans]|uniref:FecCD family ABC transporter permease n=1 Tax=Anaerovorax odorimutans TaxID=109327 RepID=UPI000419819C|nr:iron ABC transporter permease [Anaerovorax odorimutans]
MILKKGILNIAILSVPIIFILGTLFVGRYHVSFSEVIYSLLAPLDFDVSKNISRETLTVVTQLRLPRAIAGAFIGAGLAASGCAFQGVFRNPLVNSGLLGVSSGAGFGAALAIILFAAQWTSYVLAFSFGIIAVGMSYWIARIYKSVPTVMLILGGTIVSSLFSALLSFLKYVADTESQLPTIVYWLMGSLSSVGYSDFWALIPVVSGLIILFIMSWKINVLSMGDKEAQTMGVDVKRNKLLIITGATLATAGSVCMSGMIGWVGLIIPHMGRMIVGNDNRRLMPVSMSMGAAFMVLIDTISRSITASEIPLGILTSLIGAPFFIYLLKKTKGGGWK